MTAPKLIPPLLGYYTMAGGGAPVATPWYLAGGVSAANCVAAYQPKGAADYATSKVNLTGNATYDAVNGAAYPTWDDTNGWKFAGASSQYLDTSIYVAGGWSWAIRWSNAAAANNDIFGSEDGSGRAFSFDPVSGNGLQDFYNLGGFKGVAPAHASGTAIGTNQKGYYDGTEVATGITAWSGAASGKTVFIGGRNQTTPVFKTGYVQALAIYNATLSEAQIAAITTAMAAL